MAYTAGTGFRYWKHINGNVAEPYGTPYRIANSTTLRVGDVVRVNTAGFLVANGATSVPAGILLGFQDENGINPFSLGYGSRTASTLTGDDTLAVSATNQTRADYINGMVAIDPSGEMLWLNDASADLALTNLFQFYDIDSNSRQIDAATNGDANGIFQLITWDPQGTSVEVNNPVSADASKGAFRMNENQFSAGIDTGTAKNAA